MYVLSNKTVSNLEERVKEMTAENMDMIVNRIATGELFGESTDADKSLLDREIKVIRIDVES